MTKQHFNYQDLLKSGWSKTRQHSWFLACTFIIIYVLLIAVKGNPVLGMLIPLLIGLSLATLSLLIVNNESFEFSDLFRSIRNPATTLKYLALCVLYIVSVIAGLILLVIPGIYIAIRFKFFSYVVIEHPHMNLSDLITKSYMLTENNFWSVFVFLVILTVMNMVGALTIVGLLVTVPISLFASAMMYNKLKHHA